MRSGRHGGGSYGSRRQAGCGASCDNMAAARWRSLRLAAADCGGAAIGLRGRSDRAVDIVVAAALFTGLNIQTRESFFFC